MPESDKIYQVAKGPDSIAYSIEILLHWTSVVEADWNTMFVNWPNSDIENKAAKINAVHKPKINK